MNIAREKKIEMLPFSSDLIRRAHAPGCSVSEHRAVSRADALVAGSHRGWRRHILTGAFSYEHAGLGSFSLFFSSSSELSALRMSNNFSFTVASPYHLTLPARSLHLHSEKGMELTIVPAFWTISEVSYPSKETVPLPLSSTPSAVPSRLRYIPALPPPHLQPWHRGPVLLMSKGIAYI